MMGGYVVSMGGMNNGNTILAGTYAEMIGEPWTGGTR
jgi:hypothetical protein